MYSGVRGILRVVEGHAQIVAVIGVFFVELVGIEVVCHHQTHLIDPAWVEAVADRDDVAQVDRVLQLQIYHFQRGVVVYHREIRVGLPVARHGKARGVGLEVRREGLEIDADRFIAAEHRVADDGLAGVFLGIEDRGFRRPHVDVLDAARRGLRDFDEAVAVRVLRPVVGADDEAELVQTLPAGDRGKVQIGIDAVVVIAREGVSRAVAAVRRVPGPYVPRRVAAPVVGGVVVAAVVQAHGGRGGRRLLRVVGLVLRIQVDHLARGQEGDRLVVRTLVRSRLSAAAAGQKRQREQQKGRKE